MPENKQLNLFGVTSLTIISLIGTGMFFGPAIAASYAGPAALIAWVILGLQTIYVGFIFGELASMYPKAGGVYEFGKQAYGRFTSFLIGWVMWLVATINSAVLIVAALQYAFPTLPGGLQLITSIAILIGLHYIAYRGLGWTEALIDFFAAALIVFIVLTIIGGSFKVNTANYEPFFLGSPLMIAVALFFILETFFGWETACFLAEETKNPRVNIPKAIMISSVVGAILGVVLAAILYGVSSVHGISPEAPILRNVFSLAYGELGVTLLRAGVFLALIGSAAGNIVSQPRLLQAMARDKLFIAQFAKKNKKTGAPGRAILFQLIVSAIVLTVAFGNYTLLLSLLVPMALLMYIPTMIAVPVLRFKNKEKRIFNCPFPRTGPVIASLVFLAALLGWVWADPMAVGVLRFLLSLLLFGLPIYLLLSIYYNPSTQLLFSDAFAYPALFLENFIVPKKIRKTMIDMVPNLKGKTILELGAGVGSFTMHLAEEVTQEGKVIAVEAGRNNLDLLLRRIEQTEHVTAIHDEHATNRLHPDIKSVDAVYSLGMLGYLQDTQKVLKEINDILPDHGRICFMEWVDYFGLLPNPHYISDVEELKKSFEEAGFSVRIERVGGLFWNYLIVTGIKSGEKVPFV